MKKEIKRRLNTQGSRLTTMYRELIDTKKEVTKLKGDQKLRRVKDFLIGAILIIVSTKLDYIVEKAAPVLKVGSYEGFGWIQGAIMISGVVFWGFSIYRKK